MWQKKGQSTLEYIIVLTAIVAAIIVAANTIIKHRIGNIFDHVGTQAETAVRHINFQ